MGLKVKGLFFEPLDFFTDFPHRVEEDGRLIVHRRIQKIHRDLFELSGEEFDFVFFHTYRIARNAQKARFIFAIV